MIRDEKLFMKFIINPRENGRKKCVRNQKVLKKTSINASSMKYKMNRTKVSYYKLEIQSIQKHKKLLEIKAT